MTVTSAAIAAAKRVERIGDATLLLGDCLDILPHLGPVDAVVTDPPYGVNGSQNTKTAKNRDCRKNDYDTFDDSPEYVGRVAVEAVRMCLTLARSVIVTPGNLCVTLYPQPSSFGAIYQPASVGLQPWGRADSQPILYYGKSPHGGKALPGQRCSFVSTAASEPNGHPCPKPLELIKSLVAGAALVHEQVLDPFMGSGTTGVACAKSGRPFIGIELSENYFDIACRRIEDAYKQPDFFVSRPAPAVHEPLFPKEAAE